VHTLAPMCTHLHTCAHTCTRVCTHSRLCGVTLVSRGGLCGVILASHLSPWDGGVKSTHMLPRVVKGDQNGPHNITHSMR
jgi:hypothetical protein